MFLCVGGQLNHTIFKNPGRKATAKLMLNSFGGKFGERKNKPCVATILSPVRLFLRVSDPLLKIHCIRICTFDVLEIVFTSVNDNAPTSLWSYSHLCSRIHDLSGQSRIVQVIGKARRTSPLLSHRFCDLLLATCTG